MKQTSELVFNDEALKQVNLRVDVLIDVIKQVDDLCLSYKFSEKERAEILGRMFQGAFLTILPLETRVTGLED